jgi:hypothetical protein
MVVVEVGIGMVDVSRGWRHLAHSQSLSYTSHRHTPRKPWSDGIATFLRISASADATFAFSAEIFWPL